MDIDYPSLAAIVVFFIALAVIRYLVAKKQRRFLHETRSQIDEFIRTFDASSLSDFSAFNFETAQESLVAPFPTKECEEWRYIVYLSITEVEDFTTIAHEITECTIGRLIEKLLSLEKPLYLKRKQEDKFWVRGRTQKYLLEHFVTTLSEIGQIDRENLKGRLSEEDLDQLAE